MTKPKYKKALLEQIARRLSSEGYGYNEKTQIVNYDGTKESQISFRFKAFSPDGKFSGDGEACRNAQTLEPLIISRFIVEDKSAHEFEFTPFWIVTNTKHTAIQTMMHINELLGRDLYTGLEPIRKDLMLLVQTMGCRPVKEEPEWVQTIFPPSAAELAAKAAKLEAKQ